MSKLIKYICILHILGLFETTTLASNQSIILGEDKYIKVMSPDLNTTILTLSGHTNEVACLKILPDGRLASASYDATVRIWNLTNGIQDFILYGHTDSISSLDVLANGYLVSVGVDLSICVWNTTTGSLVTKIDSAHFDNINIVKTINKDCFATGSDDTLVKVWDSNNFNYLRSLSHSDTVNTIEILSDGTFVSGSSSCKLYMWDLDNGMLLYTYQTSYAIYVIKEISPQVIAIAGTINSLNFYRVNGSMTPVLINSIALSSLNSDIYCMVTATVSSGSLTSKILYAGGVDSYTTMVNITDLNNISFRQIVSTGSIIFAIENSIYDQKYFTNTSMTTSSTASTSTTTTSTVSTNSMSSFYTIVSLQDMSYMVDNMIDSIQEKSVFRCGLLCTSNSLCHVFVYVKSTLNCSLYKQSPSQFVPSLISISYIRN